MHFKKRDSLRNLQSTLFLKNVELSLKTLYTNHRKQQPTNEQKQKIITKKQKNQDERLEASSSITGFIHKLCNKSQQVSSYDINLL